MNPKLRPLILSLQTELLKNNIFKKRINKKIERPIDRRIIRKKNSNS